MDGVKLIYRNSPDVEVDLVGYVLYESTIVKERFGQQTYTTLDGSLVTFDKGVNLNKGSLVISGVEVSGKEDLEDFILNTVNFGEKIFDIEPLSANVDVGAGVGNMLEDVKFNKTTLEDVFELSPPGVYKIKLPYIW